VIPNSLKGLKHEYISSGLWNVEGYTIRRIGNGEISTRWLIDDPVGKNIEVNPTPHTLTEAVNQLRRILNICDDCKKG
jgi:hypothetical protein